MRVRRAALLIIVGVVLLPGMAALGVFMILRSGSDYHYNPQGPDWTNYRANSLLMFVVYLILAVLCALWGYAVAFGKGDE